MFELYFFHHARDLIEIASPLKKAMRAVFELKTESKPNDEIASDILKPEIEIFPEFPLGFYTTFSLESMLSYRRTF